MDVDAIFGNIHFIVEGAYYMIASASNIIGDMRQVFIFFKVLLHLLCYLHECGDAH